MDKGRFFRYLSWIWIISLFGLSLSVLLVDGQRNNFNSMSLGSFLLFLVVSIPLSLPAYLFFLILGIQVLKREFPLRKKKVLLILINYTDIFLTFLVLLGLINHGHFDRIEFTTIVPVLVLVISSTLAIILLPLKNTNQKTQI